MKNKPPLPSPPSARDRRGETRAFSLVELLVVMAIIGLLVSIAVVGLGNFNRGAGARGAADLAASMALAARVEAMSMGLGAALVVDNGSDPRTKLRRMAIFRRVADPADSSKTILQLAGNPVSLQENIYFLPGYSDGFDQMNVDFPRAANTPVLAYVFTPTGHIDDSKMTHDIRMVFSPGPLDGSGQPVSDAVASARSGILLRKNGRPTFFTSPEQMTPTGP